MLLINNIRYFFYIDEKIPHVPTAFILFQAFFLGWLVNRLLKPVKETTPRLLHLDLPRAQAEDARFNETRPEGGTVGFRGSGFSTLCPGRWDQTLPLQPILRWQP